MELDAVGAHRLRRLERLLAGEMASDDSLLPRHGTEKSPGTFPSTSGGRSRVTRSDRRRRAGYQGLSGKTPDFRAGTTASASRPRVSAPSISPKSRRAMS